MPRVVPGSFLVLEEKFQVPGPSDASRIQISERRIPFSGRFNTLSDPLVRELTISGPELRFDGSVEVLEALLLTRDVTRVTLVADEIRITKVVRWRGARVDIHARRLVFREFGRIETTPEAEPGSARAERRNERGDPLDATNTVRAADGRDGEAGGDIHLYVAEVDWGSPVRHRFVTDGAPGQTGEPGGLLPFVPRAGGPPDKDVEEVTLAQLKAVFADVGNSTADLTDLRHWKTAGGFGAAGLSNTWKKIKADTVSRGELKLRADHAVTDVRVALGFQKVFQLKLNEVRVPLRVGPERLTNVPNRAGMDAVWQEVRALGEPWVPSDGEDAYPSGTTGRGGAGGTLTVPTGVRVPEGAFSGTGGASTPSARVSGGAAGRPRKYLVAAFNAVQFVSKDETYRRNWFPVTETPDLVTLAGETRPGRDAEGTAGGKGEDGKLEQEEAAWLDPRLIRIVADLARELYGAGQRKAAWGAIEPYWRARDDVPDTAEARSAILAITGMAENYQENLDLYGNPPGWVPRFSASSYLQTYLADRQFSYRFVAVMERAVGLMSSVEDANAMLRDLSGQTEQTVARLQGELFDTFLRYHRARTRIDAAQGALRTAQQDLDALKNEAGLRAGRTAKERAVVKAVFDISGAVLQAIPVYQPAFAALGTVVASVGGVVAENVGTGKAFDALGAVEEIGKTVAETVKANANTFRTQLQDELKEAYADELDPETADLRERVSQLRTQIATAEAADDDEVRAAHDRMVQDERLRGLLETSQELREQLAALPRTNADLLQRIAAYDKQLESLPTTVSEDPLRRELAHVSRQRLLLARDKLYAALGAAQDQIRALEREADKNEAERAKTLAERDAAVARRKELEDKRKALEKILPGLEKHDATERIKKATRDFGKVLDGVAGVAKGAANIAASIRAATTEPDPKSEEVGALREQVLKGPFGARYAAIQVEVEAATGNLRTALVDLAACNQQAQVVAADFTSTLQATIDISRNRLAFSRAVDAGLKASVVAMQRQAQERMDYYLYLFRKAYTYEFCALPGAQLGRMNTFVAQLDTALGESLQAVQGLGSSEALRGLSRVIRAPDERFATAGDDALRNTLADLARLLLSRRQERGGPSSAQYRFWLPEDHLAALAGRGSTTLERGTDLLASERDPTLATSPLLRITNLQIAKSDLTFRAAEAPSRPIRIVVTVGRELPLWDGKNYYMFRIGDTEKPLNYGFVANHFTPAEGGWRGEFVPDSRGVADELFTTVMTKAAGTSISFNEFHPSFLASLRVSVTLGGDQITGFDSFGLLLTLQTS